MSDEEIQKLESEFPSASGVAFTEARKMVLASGQSVMQSQDGVIYEVFPDGNRIEVKSIEKPSLVISGTILHIR